MPRSIEDVDNFKRDKKAQHTGADVMTVVQGDQNAVVSTFADMAQTPPPAPPEHTPEALPPEEVAPAFVFFASPLDSSYITGEVLTLLGGDTTAG